MLSTNQIGQRVVVRRRLPPTSDGTAHQPTYGDVLGVLESWTAGVLAVRRAEGDLVHIAETEVVAGKPIPPRPPRRTPRGMAATGERLAAISAAGWPAPDSTPLGEWQLRAAGGFTGRANSALVIGTPGIPLDDALATVRRFYQERDLPVWAQVLVDSPYERELSERGWTIVASGSHSAGRHDTVLVQAVTLDTLRHRLDDLTTGDSDASAAVRLAGEMDDGWFARYRGGAAPSDAARQVLMGPETVAFARLDGAQLAGPDIDEPDPLAVGRGVVVDEWLGLAAIDVAPAARRRGLARAIITALTDWGQDHGARWAYVQVGAENTAALRLYERLGFSTDHAYRYYAAPG